MKQKRLFSLLALLTMTAACAWAQTTLTTASPDGTIGSFTDTNDQSREGIVITLTVDGTDYKYAIATANETENATKVLSGNAYYTFADACTHFANGKTDGSYIDAEVWRLPTKAEYESLTSLSDKAWNETDKSYKLTIGSSTLFLPAAGYCYSNSTSASSVGSYGYYWSSYKVSSDWAYALSLGSSEFNVKMATTTTCQSVRLFCLLGEAPVPPTFDLTLADGSDAHGTVTFTVDGAAATEAQKDAVVTVSVTPAEGYAAKDVTVRAYTSWGAAEARAARAAAPSLLDEIDVTENETDGTWTFTMPEANVWVEVTYTKNLQDAWIEAIADQTYTGEAIEPTVTVKDGETTLTLGTDYTVSYADNTAAGTATVTVTAKEGSDYSGTASKTFTIQKADITLTTAPVGKNLTYTGGAQELIEAGSATGGEMQYSLDGTTYSSDIPMATELGSYTVFYKVVGDANHNDTEAQSVPASITGTVFAVSANAYATHITNQAISLSSADATAGVKLYTVTDADQAAGTVTLTELTSIDANTPMIVYNPTDADRNVVFLPATGTMEAQPAAVFKGTIDSKTFTAADMEAADHYALSNNDFVWVKDAGTLAGGKCWIELAAAAGARAAAPRLSIIVSAETTGLSLIPAVAEADGVWYDLNGRRLAGKPSAKGLYIVNGKKAVVK